MSEVISLQYLIISQITAWDGWPKICPVRLVMIQPKRKLNFTAQAGSQSSCFDTCNCVHRLSTYWCRQFCRWWFLQQFQHWHLRLSKDSQWHLSRAGFDAATGHSTSCLFSAQQQFFGQLISFQFCDKCLSFLGFL
jgi:hypothetical protein